MTRTPATAMGVRRLGLFGSIARGESGPDGNLDFVVELEPKTYDAWFEVREFLRNLFSRNVDLVLESAVKPRLRSAIIGQAIHAPGL